MIGKSKDIDFDKLLGGFRRLSKTFKDEFLLELLFISLRFKPVMMAALRSLLPKSWSTTHETAWEWLWTTVARNLKEATMTLAATLDLLMHL